MRQPRFQLKRPLPRCKARGEGAGLWPDKNRGICGIAQARVKYNVLSGHEGEKVEDDEVYGDVQEVF